MRRFLLFAIVASAILGACGESSTPPNVLGAAPADSADQFIIGMDAKLLDGGVQRAQILAETAYTYQANTLWKMHGINSKFYTSSGVMEAVMTGRRAIYDTRTEFMEAFGSVIVVSLDGRRLTTPHLRYNKSENLIQSDSAFKLTGPDRTMEGVGFDSDPGMNRFVARRFIKASAGAVVVPPPE